ncbi:MAG: acyltransferase family protein [Lachnospiraceae bacterium]|nr:acyltransferase family protein [Lachnospiraceae bacterium]
MTGKKIVIVDVIKAAACIMIFLYHCNTILPGEWKFITIFGQDLGNNLFFMVSGFTLAYSIKRSGWREFGSWYLKRLKRILPMTALAYALTWVRGYYSFSDPAQLFAVFIYPTLYWFITAILIFYILLFIVGKLTDIRVQGLLLILLAGTYTALAGRQERLYVIGFFSMLTGYVVMTILEKRREFSGEKKRVPLLCIIFFLSVAVFIIAENMEVSKLSGAMILTGMTGTGVSALIAGYILNDELSGWFADKKRLTGFIRYLGGMALPLYLVQCFCSGYIGFYIGLHVNFPLSFLVNFVVVWSAGTTLYFLNSLLMQKGR